MTSIQQRPGVFVDIFMIFLAQPAGLSESDRRPNQLEPVTGACGELDKREGPRVTGF